MQFATYEPCPRGIQDGVVLKLRGGY
jgi:hypothetical protein